MEKRGEIILYQPDSEVRLEVRLEDETVWLTQAQIVELFQSSKANISEHIKNIYEQGELDESSTVRDFRTVRQEGRRYVERVLTYYNLDAIISIGFRVNSKRGIQFRQWANKVLKEYLLKGHAVNYRLDIPATAITALLLGLRRMVFEVVVQRRYAYLGISACYVRMMHIWPVSNRIKCAARLAIRC